MIKTRREWPEVGELVVATISKIVPFGAYVKIDEYGGKEGFVHISEIASTWVRNIRSFVREGQKVILQVLRVDLRHGHIDLSLRRVTEQQKRRKLVEWKRLQRAHKLLELVAKRKKKSIDEAYEKAGWKMEDYFGEIFAGFEAAAEEGIDPLLKAGVPRSWAKTIAEIAKKYVTIPKIKITGELTLQTKAPNGIELIKKSLITALETAKRNKYEVSIYLAGSPRYRISVKAKDHKEAEKILREIAKTATQEFEKTGGKAEFTRIK